MRIIAGSLKGRRLKSFEGDDIRPTSDRARESIFNLLMHGKFGGQNIFSQVVADLCCGTGALGLEAISRGAAKCFFIDQSKKSIELAKDNALHCNVTQQCQFILADATRLPKAADPVALVLMDPPYATSILDKVYGSLQQNNWLAPGTLIVSEQKRDNAPPILQGTELLENRGYGKAAILIYRVI